MNFTFFITLLYLLPLLGLHRFLRLKQFWSLKDTSEAAEHHRRSGGLAGSAALVNTGCVYSCFVCTGD